MFGFTRVCAFLLGAVLIILGIWLMASPADSLMSMVLFMGIAMLIHGAYEIYLFCSQSNFSGWILASGIVSALLGIWLIASPNLQAGMMAVMPFLFAFWVMMSGSTRIAGAFSLRDLQSKKWGWVLVLGIIGLLLGFLLMFSPVVSALTLAIAFGCSFLWAGITSICLAFA